MGDDVPVALVPGQADGLIPARYFASSLQTLYQAGNVLSILLVNTVCLLLLAAFWLTLTARKTRRTLE